VTELSIILYYSCRQKSLLQKIEQLVWGTAIKTLVLLRILIFLNA